MISLLFLLFFPFFSFANQPEDTQFDLIIRIIETISLFLSAMAVLFAIADILKVIAFLIGRKEKINFFSHRSLPLLCISLIILGTPVFHAIFLIALIISLIFLLLGGRFIRDDVSIIKNEPILPQLVNIGLVFLKSIIFSIVMVIIMIITDVFFMPNNVTNLFTFLLLLFPFIFLAIGWWKSSKFFEFLGLIGLAVESFFMMNLPFALVIILLIVVWARREKIEGFKK